MSQPLHGFIEEQQDTIDRLRATIAKLYNACEAAEAFTGGLVSHCKPGPDLRLFQSLQTQLIDAMTNAKTERIDDGNADTKSGEGLRL